MSKTFQRISAGRLTKLLGHAMESWHPILHACEVEVVVLEVRSEANDGTPQPAIRHGGYPALATIKVCSTKDRALGLGDALLSYDGHAWEELSVSGIDEETGELLGKLETDSLGRPRLRIRLHDWNLGGFTAVARRHRDDSIEVQAVNSCVDAHGQYYWDWAQAELFARAVS